MTRRSAATGAVWAYDSPGTLPTRHQESARVVSGGTVITSVVVGLLISAYIGLYAWLSVRAYDSFQSNAFDLGYYDQTVWNTRHGRWFELTIFQNAAFELDIPGGLPNATSFLGFHVEPILLLFALLYTVVSDPRVLLIGQAIVVGLGGWAAYLVASYRLQSRIAGIGFCLAFLLSPAIEAATLSDFHGVTLAASLLLFAFSCLQRQRTAAFVLFALLSLSAREDIGLVIGLMGLYALVTQGRYALGTLTAVVGVGWFLLVILVIVPYFSPLESSPYWERYDWLGHGPREMLVNAVEQPALWIERWWTPQIIEYVRGLLRETAYLSLLSPLTLLFALPPLLQNLLSSFDWQTSGGGHYSVIIAAMLLLSAIYGVSYAARVLAFPFGLVDAERLARRVWTIGLVALVVGFAARSHYQRGVSPLTPRFHVPPVTAHHRLASQFVAMIPPDASVSAQSPLYPHVSRRQRLGLFPTINKADYIFLDATADTFPIPLATLRDQVLDLLRRGRYRVVAADDGYLLLQRGQGQVGEGQPSHAGLPPTFYRFAEATAEDVAVPLRIRFGDLLNLEGYAVEFLPRPGVNQPPASIATFWRALKPLPAGLKFGFAFVRADGAVVGVYEQLTPTAAWFPPERWQLGQLMRIQTPYLPIGGNTLALVSVRAPVQGQVGSQVVKPAIALDEHARGFIHDAFAAQLYFIPDSQSENASAGVQWVFTWLSEQVIRASRWLARAGG